MGRNRDRELASAPSATLEEGALLFSEAEKLLVAQEKRDVPLQAAKEFIEESLGVARRYAELRGGAFNILERLRVHTDEVRQSRILAWLLDSTESHGAGTRFFKAFLKAAGIRDVDPEAGPYEVATEYAQDAARFDVLLYRAGAFVLAIEHKIGASEGEAQLERQRTDLAGLQKRWAAPVVHRVFLTPEGRPPTTDSADNWMVLRRSNLANEFEAAAGDPGAQALPGRLSVLLRDFCEVLRGELVDASV